VGRYDLESKTYPGHLNLDNILHSLKVIETIAVRYSDDLTVVGIEPGVCLLFCEVTLIIHIMS
jgi:hypothetical protein